MRYIPLLLLSVLAYEITSATNNGAVTITVDGQQQSKYVLSGNWTRPFVSVSGDSVILKGGGRVYLGDTNSDKISPDSFYQMPLLGKRFKVDVNLNEVGCSCNGALYFITMPGYNSAQQPVPGINGEYYCDANGVGGVYCPEMDMIESNKYAMASTAHTCQYVQPHYYPQCDHGGCGTNVLDAVPNAFGPGKTIDTNRPFTLSVAFIEGGDGRLATVNNYFYQEGRTIQFNSCKSDYLQWMGMSLPGIVMSISLWGTVEGGMSWLDGKSGCHAKCDLENSRVVFSNIRLETL